MTLLDDVARAIAPEYFTKSAKKLANYTGDNPAVERDSSVVASCQATALRDARAALQTVARYLRDFGQQQDSEYRGYCNALASHLEKGAE